MEVMLWPYSRQVLEKFNLSTVTNRQQETGEAKVRQGDNCDCAAQLGVHNDRGEFQPYF